MVKVLAIYDGNGPTYHRLYIPLSAMPEIEVTFTNYIGEGGKVTESDLKDYQVVYFNRIFPGNKLSQVIQWRAKYGFKLICDLDDHWDLDPNHILYGYYKEKNLSTYILHAAMVSDAVTVTHERLADAVLPYNRNVWVLPNAIDSQHPQFKINHQPSARTRLFWAGGITHEPDISILRNPIKKINSDWYLTGALMMVMGGYMEGHSAWDRMATMYTNGLRMPGVVLKGRPVHEYYSLYEYCDIAMVPLQDNKFNGHKSNLKILEAANIGKPVIVSKVNPYLDFPEHLVNYVTKQTDWYRHVRHLVRDNKFAEQQGAALKDFCNVHYNFDKINQIRCELITTIL